MGWERGEEGERGGEGRGGEGRKEEGRRFFLAYFNFLLGLYNGTPPPPACEVSVYTEERDVSEEEMRTIDGRDAEKFGAL